MSTAVVQLDERRPTATQRLIEVALRLENDENVDHWELADAALDAVKEKTEHPVDGMLTGSRVNTGVGRILDELRGDLMDAGATNVATKRTLHNAYATARAWPVDDRVDGANYWAHYELSSSTWTNRKRILERLVEDRRRQGGKGLIGTPQVRLRKSDENTPDLRPRDVKLEAALRGLIRRWASPQTFLQLADSEQEIAIQKLELLAREMRAGEFE